MGRHKQERIEIPKEGEPVSKKALNDSAVVAWGSEPNFLPLNPLLTADEKELETEIALCRGINWYNAMTDEKNRKAFFIEYAEKNFPEEAKKLKHISDDLFVCGVGHAYGIVARMIMRGWPIREKHVERLEELIKEYAKTVIAKEDKPVVMKARDPKIIEYCGVINGQLDDFGFGSKKGFPDTCMANVVFKMGATNAQWLKVHDHFVSLILELKSFIDGDAEIKDAYAGNTKANIKKIYDWLVGEPSEELVKAVKKTRKTRKKKQKTSAQILKLFTYMKYDKELNIHSIAPEDILKAEQLWVFNTKTRRLGVFYTSDENGLSVIRKSIDNYDEKTSYCKKIRKPKEFIPGVMAAGKVALRRILEDVHATKTILKSHISNDVLLLKVVK
jgi:hypothetical protein